MQKVVLVDGTVVEVLWLDRANAQPLGLRFVKHPEDPNKVIVSVNPAGVVMVGTEVKRNFATDLTNLPADIVIE